MGLLRGACHRARIRPTRWLAMTSTKKSNIINETARRANHFRFTEILSSPKIKNISLFPKTKQWHYLPVPPDKRGARDRLERAVGCGGRGCVEDERHRRVRRRRVVLTPRRWRQVGGSGPADDGGKRAVHRGELVISRKATAQGMSDCLRCPVCSHAQPLFLCVRDLGCGAHPAFPAPSLFSRANEFQNLGRFAPRDRGGVFGNEMRAQTQLSSPGLPPSLELRRAERIRGLVEALAKTGPGDPVFQRPQ